MTDALPARWRREADELDRQALDRSREDRLESALRLLARSQTWRQAADELQDQLDQEGTAHARQDRPAHDQAPHHQDPRPGDDPRP